MSGTLVISLDFELLWGFDRRSVRARDKARVLGARTAIPALLDLFAQREIHATWATVGMLFCETRAALLACAPSVRPAYVDAGLSPYPGLADIGTDEDDDPFHFAPSLIRRIAATPHQEIGTHTFSHYYCLEPGQTADAFEADLAAALRVAAAMGLRLRSLVFPRNQVNRAYLPICRALGIDAFRGTAPSLLYAPRASGARGASLAKLGRMIDAHVNLCGHRCARVAADEGPIEISASRFLRAPARVPTLARLRARRIVDGLTWAARSGATFHLWCHPHDFGLDVSGGLDCLRTILDHFAVLRDRGQMVSRSMGEIASP